MKEIISLYIANNETLAILPAKQVEYDSIVVEKEQTLFVRQTPLQIIKKTCIENWSTYEGRRQAVMYHTNFKQKVPIPICIYNGMYTFPTHSPTNMKCCWIFYEHILQIKKVDNDTTKRSMIIFKNGKELKVDVSMHTLDVQMRRTFECMYGYRT